MILLLSAFAAGNVSAQAPRIEIVDYGLYTASVVRAERDAKGLLQNTVGNLAHMQTTRTVPARLGVRFGFRFVVAGAPAGTKVTLRKITHFPPEGLRSPASKEPLARTESTITRTIGGQPGYTGYGFDDPWELVPGPWKIELWVGDRMLASESFTVIKP
jgi:hypothetical protein